MKLSVVIPNYNSSHYIERCLNSILNQTYENFEIIVVDDISQDNSVDIIKKMLRPQDKLIINKSKRLNGGTRNVGIMEATGDYILCIDCDDYFVDNKVFEDITNKLNGEDIMFLNYRSGVKDSYCDVKVHYENINDAFKDVTCAIWTKCVKRELLQDTPFPEGTLFEDRVQHYEMLLKTKTITNLDRVVYFWDRNNTESISHKDDMYMPYRFEYCGELYRLIKKMDNGELRDYLLKELNQYFNSCNILVVGL